MTTNPGMTTRLARFAALHAWYVIAAWLLALVAAFFLSGHLDISSNSGGASTDAERAREFIEEIAGGTAPAEEFILVEAAPGDTGNVQLDAVIGEMVADLRALDVVASAVSYLDGAPLLSSDGTLIKVSSTLTEDEDLAPADTILELIADANANSGLRVTSIGTISINTVFAEMVEETFAKGELTGVVAAMFIMLGVFGAVVPPLMPILLAIVTTMVGLAVGIDYSLFIV
jgi:RND superfamily putative drug exporter